MEGRLIRELIVRQALPNDLQSTYLDLSIKEGWKFGKYDLNFFYDIDKTGFYIGELNGVPVSCVSVVKYGNKFASLGFYVVAKEYRGKGFGLKTFQTAMSLLDGTYTCGLYCLYDMVPVYECSGFTSTSSLIKTYEITASIALQGLLSHNSSNQHIVIKPVNEVSFEKVSQYDNYVFGAPHDKYLKGLLSTPEQYAFVAIKDDNVVGLIVIRKALLDDGWIIAPLFADTLMIAISLLKNTFELMNSIAPNDKISLDLEIGFNPHCTALTQCLVGGTMLPHEVTTMYTKGPPLEMRKESIYVVTSTAVG